MENNKCNSPLFVFFLARVIHNISSWCLLLLDRVNDGHLVMMYTHFYMYIAIVNLGEARPHFF